VVLSGNMTACLIEVYHIGLVELGEMY